MSLGQWGEGVRQKWTNTDKCGRPLGRKIIATIFVKYWPIMPVFTFTSWSTPSFGMLLSRLSNRNTRVYIQYQNDQLFLPFSVNYSQVAMFQIMPALCPHGQGEGGGQPNVDRPGQGGGGSQKFPNLCGHSLWMNPFPSSFWTS